MANKTIVTSDFFTLVDDEGCWQIRAAISTATEMGYLIDRLKEVHEKMLRAAVPAIQQETASV